MFYHCISLSRINLNDDHPIIRKGNIITAHVIKGLKAIMPDMKSEQ